jgi:hypothetical protein
MPRVRVPIRRSGYRYVTRPGRQYPVRPTVQKKKGSGALLGLIGGLGGLLLCLLCLATMGILGLFASFIAVTAYLGRIYKALKTAGGASGHDVNMAILLAALCFVGYRKLRRSL